ncbi:MAG: SDR family oxidoreductase [Desulfobulbaceae bacterium]|nr:SDR family oxidoreductase [Desulfobulbaceae bacterium]
MVTIAELMNLTGRRALVTGATGFIGREIVETLAELGSKIILVDRPGADFAGVARGLEERWQAEVSAIPCDLESEEQRKRLFAQVKDEDGGVDILVNNAAFVGDSNLEGWVTSFAGQRVNTWRRAIEVNLTAVFELCQGCAPMLAASPGGSIINIGSTYGVCGPDLSLYEDTEMGNPAAYAASKGGVLQLTRWLATTLAPTVRVNAISPGGVYRKQPDVFVKRYEARTPLGRMATEEDFKGAVAYLASDMSAYVTGQNLLVDGGWTAW